MSDTPPSTGRPQRLGLLCRVKARAICNHAAQALNDAPLRISASAILIAVIWLGIYAMFYTVFHQLRRTPLEATVAIPLVFNFFFAAMLVLLTFSNAIIAYAALFQKNESAYLLTSPLIPLDLVTLKYLESLLISSWALVLLGIPLMLSLAGQVESQSFYWLFLAFFLAFIPIPGAVGMLGAWAVARYFPRRVLSTVVGVAAVLIALLAVWGIRSMQFKDAGIEVWLRSFQDRMGFVQSALLPNAWVGAGIDYALNGHFHEAAMYLCVTLANALFLSWLAVMFVAKNFDTAFDRASSERGAGFRVACPASGGIAGLAFFYLPPPLRLIAAKDLRTFLRDPLQWSQLVILFGLLVLYLSNMPTLRTQLAGQGWFLLIPFLNLCAISLILATFTCRFVFPLVSLEGRKLWLIALLPVPPGRILVAKFAFAMTVTLLVALTAMAFAVVALELGLVWTVIHLAVTIAICFGLCGFAVGIGARLPMFGESNAARIANGIGGTTNLLASVALVGAVLTAVGVATWRSRFLPDDVLPEPRALVICCCAVTTSIACGLAALERGAQHLNGIEV